MQKIAKVAKENLMQLSKKTLMSNSGGDTSFLKKEDRNPFKLRKQDKDSPEKSVQNEKEKEPHQAHSTTEAPGMEKEESPSDLMKVCVS